MTETMIDARKILVEKLKAEGKSEEEIYNACLSLQYEEYITEIHNAEYLIEKFAKYYHALEKDCPSSFKFIMLINDWHSPFIALNELLKRIYTNEMLLKRKQKVTKTKIYYKSRYSELRRMLQEKVNEKKHLGLNWELAKQNIKQLEGKMD